MVGHEYVSDEMIARRKKWLKRYRQNEACIARLRSRSAELDDRMTAIRSPSLTGMPRGGQGVTIDDLMSDKAELDDRIEKLIRKGQTIKSEIIDAIDDINDVKYAEVLELYFIKALDFDEIAERMVYHDKSIQRLYSRAVQAIHTPVD